LGDGLDCQKNKISTSVLVDHALASEVGEILEVLVLVLENKKINT
jgi:hypothetical protein